MPLVSLKPVLREAKAKGYAVAAFNPVDYASMKAMVKAAEELKAPVIIQSSAKTIKYYGHKAMIGWMREIADDSPVPVVLHLDHGKDVDMIKKCVEMGWTSVMIDWSDKPFEVNLEQAAAIEVLRGPASVLYGSDAMTGVVQLFTRRGAGPPKVALSGLGGSYGSSQFDLGVSGGSSRLGYSGSLGRVASSGVYDFMNFIRMERPAEYKDRKTLTPEEWKAA